MKSGAMSTQDQRRDTLATSTLMPPLQPRRGGRFCSLKATGRRKSALEIETIQEVTDKLYSQFVQQVAKTLHYEEKQAWEQAINEEGKGVVCGEDCMPTIQCKKSKIKESWEDNESLFLRPLELLNVKDENAEKVAKKSSFRRGKSGKSMKASVRFIRETPKLYIKAKPDQKLPKDSNETAYSSHGEHGSGFLKPFSRDRFMSLRKPKKSDSDEDHSPESDAFRTAVLISKLNLTNITIPAIKPKGYQEADASKDNSSTEMGSMKQSSNAADPHPGNSCKNSGMSPTVSATSPLNSKPNSFQVSTS